MNELYAGQTYRGKILFSMICNNLNRFDIIYPIGASMKNLEINFNAKLEKQLQFIIEIDKVKNIIRKSKLFDNSRFENDAEHSWTVCIMALLLKEYSNFSVNIEKVILMLLIHDIVEIDAGDTFLYSSQRNDVHNEEKNAAERIFGLLENDQKEFFMGLWTEFEE